jgi:hypothetical protein
MYKLSPLNLNGQQESVIRTTDNACIPFDPDNTDYQAFLKYQAEGGVVLPADDNEQAA